MQSPNGQPESGRGKEGLGQGGIDAQPMSALGAVAVGTIDQQHDVDHLFPETRGKGLEVARKMARDLGSLHQQVINDLVNRQVLILRQCNV